MKTKMSEMHMAVLVVLGLAAGMVRSDSLAVEPALALNARGLFVERENSEAASAAEHSPSSLNYNEPCYEADGYPVYKPYGRLSNIGSSYEQEQSKLASPSCNNQYARYYDGLGGLAGIVAPYGVPSLSNIGAPSAYSTADSRVGGVSGYARAGGYGKPVEYGNVAGFGSPGVQGVGDIGEYGGPYGDVWSSSPGSYFSTPGQFIPDLIKASFPQVFIERYDPAP